MSTGFTFTVDPDGLKDIATSDEMKTFLNEHAERALAEAQRIAPVNTGAYLSSLGITLAEEQADGTLAAQLWSDDPFWHLIEYGSINNPPYRVLEQAVTAAGLDFADEGA